MMYPLVLDLAAKDAQIRVPVTVTCRMLKFSKQAFYAWKKCPVSQRDFDDAQLINVAFDEHMGDPFGARPGRQSMTISYSAISPPANRMKSG